MNKKTFLNGIANGKSDIIQEIIDLLVQSRIEYCVIGGLAVNAYVEPVVSLDLDIVVVAGNVDKLVKSVEGKFKIERFPHSINLNSTESDIRIQLQTDARYQEFIKRASTKNVMGYQMAVAALEDVLTGKCWAYLDEKRRGSKRQKDLADIMRIIESYPQLKSKLPDKVVSAIGRH